MWNFLYFICCISFLNNCYGEVYKFPVDFQFGVSTASYQIEGGWNASGKGENIWDRFTHTYPELISDSRNGDVACDSYHLWKEDVRILKEIGVHFYRFSLSWSRLLPTGFSNYVNADGVNYYNNLINELLSNGIQPMVTLYHWDLPQPLQDLGGWPNPILATYFEDYARIAFSLFGDRVKTWVTINEPPEICQQTYQGNYALRVSSSGIGDYLCGHTLILAHAKVYKLYNDEFRDKQNGKVGITVNCQWNEPKSKSQEDVDAAARAMQMDCGWWLHPIYSKTGDYPSILKERVQNMSKKEKYSRSRLPIFTKDEIAQIRGTYDFFGLNHYSTYLTSNFEYPISDPTSHIKDVGVKNEQDPKWEPSLAPWLKVVPWGFRKLLNWIKTEYDNPVTIITENGYADDGRIQDTGRVNYYEKYLASLLEAIHEDGCNVTGYTAWSSMDNWEWRNGYTLRFGLYNVDFDSPNRTRTPKTSAQYYKQVIKNKTANGKLINES